MEEGRYLYKFAKADIGQIIDSALDGYRSEIKKKKIRVIYDKPADFPEIMIDSEKIKIVVQNLIDNAIKYSPDSGKIGIFLHKSRGNIEFEVNDSGIGIPKEQRGKIFQKFFRADNAVTMNTAGTGLGLFLSKNIVEAHGGIMDFKSEKNGVTKFYFTLPLSKNEL
jgi:signal transduction histidine kinase